MYSSLFARDLISEMARLSRDVQRAFDTVTPSIRGFAQGFPALNVGSTPSSVEIYAFAPGLDPAKIEIDLDRRVLTIAGERTSRLTGNGSGSTSATGAGDGSGHGSSNGAAQGANGNSNRASSGSPNGGSAVTATGGSNGGTADGRATAHINERFNGRFRRVVSLPEDIDADGVSAEYRDGILHVSVKRRESTQPRRISVQ